MLAPPEREDFPRRSGDSLRWTGVLHLYFPALPARRCNVGFFCRAAHTLVVGAESRTQRRHAPHGAVQALGTPAAGLTPYNNMHKVLDVCQSFVQTFDNSFSNLLLTGETGVGKTFLANCIAKELLDTYHSVIYLTATEFFKCFENSDFRRNLDNSIDVNYFLECDLLIIDDLGTESSNSYTNSKLFYVINERLLRNKSVIISSNFTISQIEDFYSERIFSRIISSYTILRLFGTDIRYLKRTKMLKN